jgi:hypothetical protein
MRSIRPRPARCRAGRTSRGLVIADQPELFRKQRQQRRPDRALPIELDVVQPIGCLHNRQTVSARRNGEVHAVRRPAERHFLGCRGFRRRSCGEQSFAPLFVKVPHEADAPLRHRTDEGLLLTAVAERAARGIDAVVQRRLGYDPPAPDVLEQVLFAHHAVAVPDEMQDEVEHLRFDVHGCATAGQFAPVGVDGVVAE